MLVMGLVAEVDEETSSGEGEGVGVDECRERRAMRDRRLVGWYEAMQHALVKLVAGSEDNKVRRAVPATAKSVSHT
jgi:hypothetical protein